MPGAVFGEVGVWLFVAGAAFGDILGDSRSAKCCIFQYKIASKMGWVRSPKRRVRDDDFIFGLSSDYVRIMVESSFYWRKQFTEFPLKSWTYRFRGRCSIWWGWWLTVLAPRIGNDVAYETRSIMRFILRGRRSIWWGSRLTLLAPRILNVNDVSYVTRINHKMHFAWQAQYLVKLECDFTWQAQHLVTFWEIAGARNVVFFNTKSSPRWDE